MSLSLGRRIALLGSLVAGGAGLLVAQGPNADAARLASLVDEYMAHAAAAGGGLARGLSPDRIAGLSLQRAHEESAWAAGIVKKLADVHPAELTHDQWITYSDLLFDVTGTADADRYFWFITPVTPYSSPLRGLTTPFESFQFKTAADARDVPRRAESGADRDRRLRGEAARSDAARHRAAGRRDSARPAVRAHVHRRAAAERRSASRRRE